MEYKVAYDEEADVLSLIISVHGEFFHAEEAGDLVIHFSKEGSPLFHRDTKGQQNDTFNGRGIS